MPHRLLLLFISFSFCLSLGAQQATVVPIVEGGMFSELRTQDNCLDERARANIHDRLAANRQRLGLPTHATTPPKSAVPALSFPLRMRDTLPGLRHPFAISGYVDHDASDGTKDYACEERTYDGHQGTDWYTFPFAWYYYENDLAEVIAAAPGVIIGKDDGNADQYCAWGDNRRWNAVYVEQEDGSVVWYGHLKKGSLTEKRVGASVARGEYLGVVASSGRSSGPHLHFEYYDALGQLKDPFAGSCNDRNSNSLWIEQPAHTQPRLNAVLTHDRAPLVQCGVTREVAALTNSFEPGDRVYVGTYLTDYRPNTSAHTRVRAPDGVTYRVFNTRNENAYDYLYGYVSFDLPQDAPEGEWRAEASMGGQRLTHSFTVGKATSTSVAQAENLGLSAYPNPTAGTIHLRDADRRVLAYAVYSATGEVLLAGRPEPGGIAVSHLPAGTYFLRLQTRAGTVMLPPVVKL